MPVDMKNCYFQYFCVHGKGKRGIDKITVKALIDYVQYFPTVHFIIIFVT